MKDYVRMFCDHYRIHLIYTKNKYTLLSTGVKKDIPVLRVHKLLRGCPYDVAHAIEDYYILGKNPIYSLEILEKYIRTHLELEQYKIIPPVQQFQFLLEESRNELKISRIVKTDLSGHSIHIAPNQSILFKGENVLELDITVESGS